MNEFFLKLLDKVEILTGIRQLERLQAKPMQLKELIEECSKAALQFPLKEEITKSVLMDAVSSDLDFIGLNVKWVRKVLNTYCQVHGVNKENQKEETVDLIKRYQDMVLFWSERPDLDTDSGRLNFAKENLKRVEQGIEPVDDIEGIKIMAEMFTKQISGTILAAAEIEYKGSGSRLKDVLDHNSLTIPDEVKEAKEIERQYRLENYDDNGNCAEHWKPKDEWLKKREKNPATG